MEIEINKKNNLKYLVTSVIIIFVISVIGYFIFSTDYSEKEITIDTLYTENGNHKIKKLNLIAKAVYVWRVKTEETLYSLNENSQLPLASLSKVMTALTAYELQKNQNNIITINEKNLDHDGNNGLEGNEKWKLNSLMDFTLLVSSNDGANAVASAVEGFKKVSSKDKGFSFISKMNEYAKELNLTQTYFINESGLDVDETYQGGAYGSAKDIVKLLNFVIQKRPHIMEVTTYDKLFIKSESGLIHNAKNTNEIINDIPWVIASKTGFTDLAGGNLVVVFDNGLMDPIIIAVLGSTQEGRFEDVQKIVDEIIK